MKASEVLSRYANGERNFRNANLRGQSFKGQDLSGADFSGADIRSTNFTNAILKETNFSGAKAGLQRRWMVLQVLIAFLLSTALTSTAAIAFGQYISAMTVSEVVRTDQRITFLIINLTFLIAVLTICYHGFTAKTIGIIATVAGSTVVTAVVISFIAVSASDEIKDFLPILVSSAVAGSFAIAVMIAAIVSVGITISSCLSNGIWAAVAGIVGMGSSIVIASSNNIYVSFRVNVNDQLITAISGTTGISSSIIAGFMIALLSLCIFLQTSVEDRRFALSRTISITFGSIGGTSFCGASLTRANFDGAILENTNFQASQNQYTDLTYISLKGAKKLIRARVENTILGQPAVRELLVSRNGYRKSYRQALLLYTDLSGVNLDEADLQLANLNGAILQRAALRGANLQEVLALGADFRNAALTGACLEAWNIDATTNLEAIDCQYIYLIRDKQERRPSSGDFAPGEFTKLFQEMLTTVDLIFRNGVDWKAFVAAVKQVRVENEDIELAVQSFEDKGDGVIVVRVRVPPEADKGKIHSSIIQNYVLTARLEEKEQRVAFLEKLAIREASRSIKVVTKNTLMSNSSDQSQNINVGRDMNLSGSTLNLGKISGSVTNTIHQLQTNHPEAAQLADLLKQLQTAIESDKDLSNDDKAEALEQVGTLAKAGENPQADTTKKSAHTAVKILKGTIAALPDTAKLAEACSKLLPAIVSLLGL